MKGIGDGMGARQLPAVLIAAGMACGSVVASSLTDQSASDPNASRTNPPSTRMADGKQWTTANLNVDTQPSYCYDDAQENCRRYGRLYTWESAQRACESLGKGWRLPTSEEWTQLAKHYGGVSADSADKGTAAYKALMTGGSSGFDAVLGGARDQKGAYARGDAHGIYWTASTTDPGKAWFFNFGKGGQALHRGREGDKQWAFSIRCVSE